MEKFLCLALNLLIISIPLLASFEHRINYASKWYALFPAILITAVIFLKLDKSFTSIGVWRLNKRYLLGPTIFGLPVEEFLIFVTVPYSFVLIYEILNYYFHTDFFEILGKPFMHLVILLFLILGITNWNKRYTSINFLMASATVAIHLYIFEVKIMSKFLLTFIVQLVPFFVCNGILTGSLTKEPVVIYNNSHNLGLRIGTVPIEDIIYTMTLLLMNVSLYEAFL